MGRGRAGGVEFTTNVGVKEGREEHAAEGHRNRADLWSNEEIYKTSISVAETTAFRNV